MISFKNKKGLGRGLSSLIGEGKASSNTKASISDLTKNKYQPRKKFDETSLNELSESIKSRGIIQPIIVRNSNGEIKYEIIAGERRWRAAQIAQLHEMSAVIKNLNDTESLEIAIIENVQRSDLTVIEEATGYKKLIESYGHTQEQLSEIVGKSRSHVANIMRLLTLPQSIQDMITEGRISAGHARAIMNSAFPEKLAEKIVNENLTVREAESIAKHGKNKIKKVKLKDPDTVDLENSLSLKLGLNVEINHKGNKGGHIKIDYKNLDQLELVTQKLKT